MKKFFKTLVGVVAVTFVGTCMTGCSCGENKYTLTFDRGSGDVSTMELQGSVIIERPANPTRSGYVFAGWFEDSAYTTEFDFSKSISSTKTLYAKWLKIVGIGIPSSEIISHGYKLELMSTASDFIEGEKVSLQLTVGKDYIRNSTPVVKANGEEINYITSKIENDKLIRTFEYVCGNTDINFTVSGVVLDYFSIDLPVIEGAEIVSVEGYDNSKIEKYQNYKFRLNAKYGYSVNNAKVYVDGVEIVPISGIYVVPNVTANEKIITVTGVEVSSYYVDYYANSNLMLSNTSDKFTISNYLAKATHKSDYSFDIELKSEYSQIGENVLEYMDIKVGGVGVPASIALVSGNKYRVTIAGEEIEGGLAININSDNFGVNTYALTLPNTTVESEGYSIYFTKFVYPDLSEVTSNFPSSVPYGTKVYVGASFDTANYITSGVSIVKNSSGNKTAKNYLDTAIEFTISDASTFEIYNLVAKSYAVNISQGSGYEIIPEANYTNKAYFVDYATCEAYTYKFQVEIDELGYLKGSDYKVVFYTDDIANATTITPDTSGVYTIEGISSDINVAVLGVEERVFVIDLSDGLSGATFEVDGDSATASVGYYDTFEVKLTVQESHSRSINNVTMSCDKAVVTKGATEENVITFTFSQVTDNISIEDLVVNFLNINTYTIILTPVSDRTNFSLVDNEGNDIARTLSVEHGTDLLILIKPDAGYTQDNNYVVKVDNENYISDNFEIRINDITTNHAIDVSGVDTLNTYLVEYISYDGASVLDSDSATHGDEITVTQSPSVEADENYYFAGWYVATFDEGTGKYVPTDVKIEDSMIVTDNVKLLAVQEATKFYITYDMNNNSMSGNSENNYNTDDGRFEFTVETFANGGKITLDTNLTHSNIYTLDYFELVNDAMGLSAGTKITEISSEIIGDHAYENITLIARWKIVVEENGKYQSIYDALFDAEDSDKIEVHLSTISEAYLKINKSVSIVSVAEGGTTVTSTSAGSVNNGYYSFIYMGGRNKIINVTLDNFTFNYAYASVTYPATTLYAKNCNLNLNNVNVESQAHGLVFDSVKTTEVEGDINLNITGGSVFNVSNYGTNIANFTGYAIGVIGGGEGSVNISDTTIYANIADEETSSTFAGIKITGSATLGVNLDDVLFTSNKENTTTKTVALYLENEQDYIMTACEINNDNYKAWTNAIYIAGGYDNTSASDKYAILEETIRYITHNLLVDNKITDAICIERNILDNALNLEYIVASNGENLSESIRFANFGHLINYVGYGVDMTYTNPTSSLEFASVIEIKTNQTIDMSGANATFAGELIINGSLINTNILTCKTLENYGTVIASDIEITVECNNTGTITSDTFALLSGANLINDGEIVVSTALENSGSITNNTNIIAGNVVNDGNIIIADGYMEVSGSLTNLSTINSSGELDVAGSIINEENALIEISANGTIEFDSSLLVNNGTFNISGSYVDTHAGSILMGTTHDYGLNNDGMFIQKSEMDISYYLGGNESLELVGDDALVNQYFPNGTGYYAGLKIHLGYGHENENVSITYTRTERSEYTYNYVTKTVSDTSDSSGYIELILDLNGQDFYTQLQSIVIEVTNAQIDYSYTIYFRRFNLVDNNGGKLNLQTLDYTGKNYGINYGDLELSVVDSASLEFAITGTTINKATDGGSVNNAFTDGSGYYIGLTTFLGTDNAGYIGYNYTLSYGSETETIATTYDESNTYGQAQFMFDLKPVDGKTTLTKIELTVFEMVSVLEENLDEDGNLRAPKFSYTYTINLDVFDAVEQ